MHQRGSSPGFELWVWKRMFDLSKNEWLGAEGIEGKEVGERRTPVCVQLTCERLLSVSNSECQKSA